MKPSFTFTSKRAAGLLGAVFAFVFLTINDPDAMSQVWLDASKWLMLLPAAFLMAMRPSVKAWVSGLSLAGGVFVGVCLAAIVQSSNIWPIAGVYWTAVWTPPIVLGTIGGALTSRLLEGTRTR